MQQYFKLIIPFATKSWIRNLIDNEKLFLKGNAIFVYDTKKNKIINSYLNLESANFRITDLNMLKPTDYYKSKIVNNFRKNILEKWSGINNTKKLKYYNLSPEQIEYINQILKKDKSTIKTMYSYFSGSNISGSETNHLASPMRCIDNDYFNCNFANVTKDYEVPTSKKEFINDSHFPIYTLNDVMSGDIIPGFKEKFQKYNELWVYKNYEYEEEYLDNNISIKTQNISDNDAKILKEKQYDYIYAIVNKRIQDFSNLSKESIKKKLRSFFTSNVKRYINENKIPILSTIKKINLNIVKNAHIIPFSELVKTGTIESLSDAINPYNCLRIDGSTHDMFDKHEIYFDINGNVINRDGKIIKKSYLDMENMPKQTFDFYKKIIK